MNMYIWVIGILNQLFIRDFYTPMNMYIWVIGILNQLFIRDFYTPIKFLKK